MEGNKDANEITRDIIQPIDSAKVANTYRNLSPRPNLSESIQLEAATNLNILNKQTQQKLENNEIKIKQPKNITKKEREKEIETMFQKASCQIGIGPITKKQMF